MSKGYTETKIKTEIRTPKSKKLKNDFGTSLVQLARLVRGSYLLEGLFAAPPAGWQPKFLKEVGHHHRSAQMKLHAAGVFLFS